MLTLRELGRRVARLERRIPSRDVGACAPPAINIAEMREVMKTLIETGVGWIEIEADGTRCVGMGHAHAGERYEPR